MTKEIVAFIGRAGSGKDYQCKLLVDKGYKQLAFADALRKIAFNVLGLTYEEGMAQYDFLKENACLMVATETRGQSFNFRRFLELLGTQGIRKYDNDFWCKCLIKDLINNPWDKICISDMRFTNEYDYLYEFAKNNNYNYKVIFCDYHSDRYQENNFHESAKMGNWFATHNYKDLQEITKEDIEKYKEEL